jgi:hypothetical protein
MDRNRWRVGAVDRVRPALNVRVAAAAVVREVILLLTRRQRGFPSRRQPGRPSFDVLDPISMTFRIVMMISWIGKVQVHREGLLDTLRRARDRKLLVQIVRVVHQLHHALVQLQCNCPFLNVSSPRL